MGYRLEGSILEVCDCKVLCPCWIGEPPDNGTCDSAIAYHIDKGVINGIDVAGLTVASMAHIPGNVLDGHYRHILYIDDNATYEQYEALVDAWHGKLGGPLTDMARLVTDVIAIERAAITFTVKDGKGTLIIGEAIEAIMEPYRGPDGQVTTLVNSIFSTIPGSPAYVSKASRYRVDLPQHGWQIHLEDHNAIQGSFHFEG